MSARDPRVRAAIVAARIFVVREPALVEDPTGLRRKLVSTGHHLTDEAFAEVQRDINQRKQYRSNSTRRKGQNSSSSPALPIDPADPAMTEWIRMTASTSDAFAQVAAKHHRAFHQLRLYPSEILRRAAIRAYVQGQPAPAARLPLPGWLDACRALQAGKPLPGKLRAQKLLKSRQSPEHRARVTNALNQGLAVSAQKLLQERVAEGVADDLRLRLRPLVARWRVPPSLSLVGAPVIEASKVEVALVCLLSLTGPEWQFSSTPSGAMFATAKHGYTSEADGREYVSGLSSVLDTVAGVIERHRGGTGGRVFVSRQYVECAECKRIVTWMNAKGHGPVVFGRCVSSRRR